MAGHITLRDPVEPDTFWVNPFGTPFSLMKASDLIQVNHEAQVIAGGPNRLLNAAAFMIHSAIHAARPEVICAAHSHSLYGRSFCALGRPLDMITQDSCAFYNVRITSFSPLGVWLICIGGKKSAKIVIGSRRIFAIQRRGISRGRRP